MIEVDGHVCVVGDFEVCDLIVVDVIFIDLFGDDEEPDVVLLLDHDLHLVQNELQFLALVHRTVGLHLHLLQNGGGLQDVVFILFGLDDHENAPCVFHLSVGVCT